MNIDLGGEVSGGSPQIHDAIEQIQVGANQVLEALKLLDEKAGKVWVDCFGRDNERLLAVFDKAASLADKIDQWRDDKEELVKDKIIEMKALQKLFDKIDHKIERVKIPIKKTLDKVEPSCKEMEFEEAVHYVATRQKNLKVKALHEKVDPYVHQLKRAVHCATPILKKAANKIVYVMDKTAKHIEGKSQEKLANLCRRVVRTMKKEVQSKKTNALKNEQAAPYAEWDPDTEQVSWMVDAL